MTMTTIDEPAGLPLPPARRTLPHLLCHAAKHFADDPLLTIGASTWSHRDAFAAAGRAAARLSAAGVERGDRVALMCGNRIEFIEVFLACGWLGAIAVPINTAAMQPQIEYALADSGARLLVVERELAPRLADLDRSRLALRAMWLVGGDSDADGQSDAADPAPPAAADLAPGDPLVILYTSGTTGPAKGVVCPHGQLLWWGANTARILGIGRTDVLATTLPLFHVNALNTLLQALIAGCRVDYAARFSASGFWAQVHAAQATVIYVLGAMVPMLLTQPSSVAERGHRVRLGLGPGVPAHAAASFLARTGVPLLEGYGSTETNFAIATRLDAPRPGTMGWVQPGFHARVVDDHDVELPAGVAGELVLRADEPFAFSSGYFGRPEQTLAAWRNLWFHSGDRVVREADGAFRFVDRIKDVIRRRGENISSYEVEQVLALHPAVAEVAVFPARSTLAEDEVMAAVVLHAGQRVEAAALVEFCGTRLPHFAIPCFIDFALDLPRTENGKVQKYKLIERGVGATTWQRPP